MTGRTAGVGTFVPAAYDVVWSLGALTWVVLLLVALVQWFGARGTRGGGLLDVLVIVLVPVVGPIAYLISRRGAGRRDRRGAARETTG